jgi:hypothetical protein
MYDKRTGSAADLQETTMKKIIIKACEDCPYINHGMKRNWCTNPKNESNPKDLSDVNTEAAIPDWCRLEYS